MIFKIFSKYLPFILLAVVLTSTGCYTLLSHPGEESSLVHDEHESDCIRCHENYHDNYGFSHYYYPDYWSSNERWGRYYAVPWWWEYYWYDDDNQYYYNDDNEGVYPRSTRSEKPIRPNSRFQESGGNIQTGASTINRGSGSSGSSDSSPSTGKSKESTESSDTKRKKSDDSSQDSKKPREKGRWHKK